MDYLSTSDAKSLYAAFRLLKTDSDYKRFLRDLLTETEIKEFINRWKAVRLLDQKVPYEDIERQTGMSSTTIARISKWLTNGMGGYKSILQKLKKNYEIRNKYY